MAWLVLACDLPFLDAPTLDTLLLARDPDFDATAFSSSHDGLPEPLCAIYEPARDRRPAQIAAGRNCPRKFLINAHTQLLEQPNPRALDNVNTVEEYERAMSELTHPRSNAPCPNDIRVQYYALLREQAGRSDETLTTARAIARVVRRVAPAIPVHAAGGDAARGHQRGIRRMVAAA